MYFIFHAVVQCPEERAIAEQPAPVAPAALRRVLLRQLLLPGRGNSTKHLHLPYSNVVYLVHRKTGVKSTGNAGLRLAQARQVHRDVCSLLAASADALRSARRRFLRELPDAERVQLEAAANKDAEAASPSSPVPIRSSPEGNLIKLDTVNFNQIDYCHQLLYSNGTNKPKLSKTLQT